MMRALLGRPDGAGEWAMSSFAVLLGGGGGLLAVFFLLELSHAGDYLIPTAIAIHWLLWWQVLRGVWALCRDDGRDDWLLAGAVLWWLLLVGLQLLGLVCWFCAPFAASGPPMVQF